MYEQDGHTHVSGTEASGGSKEGVVRWVLAGGLLLAIILMSVVWIIPAITGVDDTPDQQGAAMEPGAAPTN